MKVFIETGTQKLEFSPTFEQVGRIIEILGQRVHVFKPTDLTRVADLVISVSRQQIGKRGRSRELTRPRYIYFYLAKKYTGRSLKQIGNHIGKFDHSDVIYGIKVCTQKLAEADSYYTAVTSAAEKLITAHDAPPS